MIDRNKRLKILITPSTFAELDKEPLARLHDKKFEVVENPFKRKLVKSELIDLLTRDIAGIIAGLEPLDRTVLKKSGLKVISRCGSGLSNVDLAVAKELGIVVCSTPDAPTQAVAELTLGAILDLLRMISHMNKSMHEGRWEKKIGEQLGGKTIVIIGFGRIGQRLAKLLKSFNVKILAVDPHLKNIIKDVRLLSMEKALPEADIITIHSNGKDCIFGEREFKLVKFGAFFLNAARGGIVNEKALAGAIKDGRIRGAWLDVFKDEPYAGPLTKYPQVILTPHAGSYTAECRKKMEMEAVDNLITAFTQKL